MGPRCEISRSGTLKLVAMPGDREHQLVREEVLPGVDPESGASKSVDENCEVQRHRGQVPATLSPLQKPLQLGSGHWLIADALGQTRQPFECKRRALP